MTGKDFDSEDEEEMLVMTMPRGNGGKAQDCVVVDMRRSLSVPACDSRELPSSARGSTSSSDDSGFSPGSPNQHKPPGEPQEEAQQPKPQDEFVI